MATEVRNDSTMATQVSCSCSTKRTRGTNRGCPCKAEGRQCGSHCTCGSTAKPCKNKPGGSSSTQCSTAAARPAQRPCQPYNTSNNRPSEEEERVKENNDVKEFIETLDEGMVRKLCIRSLRRGIGSMDYIHGLLIAEDDLDADDEVTSNVEIESQSGQTPVSASSPESGPSSGPSSALPWCKCGVCVVMPQEIENKCCGQRRCVTSHTRFQKLCLDPDVLQLAVRNRADIRNDPDDNSTRSFRKASYRQ